MIKTDLKDKVDEVDKSHTGFGAARLHPCTPANLHPFGINL